MLKKIFLFRHGETDYNREGRFQGHLDIPLNERGKLQAQNLIPFLKKAKIEMIFSSDLKRTVETAQIIAEDLKIPVLTHSGIREAFLGEAQGLTREEMEGRFGVSLVEKWKSSNVTDADVQFPGGETGKEILTRSFKTLEEFLHQTSVQTIGVSSHGGVIRRLIAEVMLRCGNLKTQVLIPNGVLYHLEYQTEERLWMYRGRANDFDSK